jgi:peptidoglycan/xylan/chitin deacetylase (PgdA/CDA1 family)
MIVGLGAAAVVLGGAAHGAFHRNSPLFGRPITRLRAPGRAVALTFDDGPNPDATPQILDALAERGV